MMRSVTTVLAAAVLLVACGNESVTGGQPSMTPSSSGSSSSSEPASPGGSVVDQAKADLTKRLGVDAAQVTVVSSEDVTWPDGSLGCPEPGMRYTQALVPGNRTVLEVGGQQYNYHSGGHRPPFLCEQPQPPSR
ncbi:hypothetical protein [Kribbella sp. VKM Ac-2569]|uniref:hypothetical protein n=1 Tax=Kribbella sp. VKM Ac-2569 TaxID=2512220 RepID=UPI00102C2092|nr:hypothetical protein [Kribbella sp. VKM Ac-2569]